MATWKKVLTEDDLSLQDTNFFNTNLNLSSNVAHTLDDSKQFAVKPTEQGQFVIQKFAGEGYFVMGGQYFTGSIDLRRYGGRVYLRAVNASSDTTNTILDLNAKYANVNLTTGGDFDVRIGGSEALKIKAETQSLDEATGIDIHDRSLRDIMTPTIVGPWTTAAHPATSGNFFGDAATSGDITIDAGQSAVVRFYLGGVGDDGGTTAPSSSVSQEALQSIPLIRACAVTGLAFNFDYRSAGVSGCDITFYIYKNDSSQGIFKTFNQVASAGSGVTSQNNVSDAYSISSPRSSDAVSFAPGDILGLRMQVNASQSASDISLSDMAVSLEVTYI